ncbi:MAG TPA: MFS transporter [Hellea balneolensis]|uniref:MFS transporter n=1 Tax=Hellea balneolensis TaxID=287478 RepID=A0A7C5QV73_9PROT|nr:MFS transporter [Hellea balneolensis]
MKQRTGALNFILIAVAIDAIGLGIIMPVLPELLTDLTGLKLNQAARHGGFLTLTYALMQFIFMPILGGLSDAFGRRKVLLLSLFCLGIDYLFMAVAPSIALLYLGRLISGATGATYSTANAYIADITEPDKRAQKFGMIGAAFGVGFVLGPAIGGLLGDLGPRVPFYVAAGISLANFAYGFFVLPETLAPGHRRSFSIRRSNPFGTFKSIFALPQLGGFLLVAFLLSFAGFVYPSTFAFYTSERYDWTPRDIGIALAAFGVASAVVQGWLIRITIPKLGLIWSGAIGILMNAAAYLGLAFSPNAFIAYMWMIPAALGGLGGPALMNLMSMRVDKSAQGELQGANGAVNGFAMLISPVMLTELFYYFADKDTQTYFPGAPFMLAGILTLLALFVFIWAVRQRPTR